MPHEMARRLTELLREQLVDPRLGAREAQDIHVRGERGEMTRDREDAAGMRLLFEFSRGQRAVFRREALDLDVGVAIENDVAHCEHTQPGEPVDEMTKLFRRAGA